MKRFIWLLINLLIVCFPLVGQGRRRNSASAHHYNFYHKIELGSGNVYGFGILSCASGVFNYLIDDAVAETNFEYPIYREQTSVPDAFSRQYLLGVVPNDLLHDFSGGVKLGYQSYSPDFFNWGVCAVGEYKREPYKWSGTDAEGGGVMGRALAGGNVMFRFGEMGMHSLFTVELGIRYSYGLSHMNAALSSPDMKLNNGLVSHYAIQIGGPGFFQDIKLYVDVPHYKVVDCPELQLSPIYLGFSWTVTPRQAQMRK